ncbi:hypothetical protein B0H21DRAFT_719244 [Amylocystis lapponica]|nr:hypothetical protein B0H21DRAFT_719244 [Amylocystis lapponica]
MSGVETQDRLRLHQSVVQSPAIGIRRLKNDPTFMKPTADVVLISSDDVVFRVHKIILAEASTFFETMFTLPQPSDSPTASCEHEGLPAMPVAERSDVLESLLRLCYPIDDPRFSHPGDAGKVLAAAMKYEMQEAIKIATRCLLGFVPMSPLQVYVVACLHRFENVASAAAKEVALKAYTRDTIPPTAYVEGMEEISAGAYYRLLAYCRCNGIVFAEFTFCEAGALVLPADTKDVSSVQGSGSEFLPGNLPDTDIILRSRDLVDFPVHGIILRIASPILEGKILDALAQSPPPHPQSLTHESAAHTSTRNSLPVVQLPESSQTLSMMLQLLYPVSNPAIPNLNEISALLAMAWKYKIRKIVHFVTTTLDAALQTQPLRVYLVTSRFRHSDLSRLLHQAAKLTLGHDIMQTYYPELELASACHFYRLLYYHRECCDAAMASIGNKRRIVSKLTNVFIVPCGRKSAFNFKQPCWFPDYLEQVKAAIKVNPAAAAIAATAVLKTTFTKLTSNKTFWCDPCKNLDYLDSVIQANEILGKEIDGAVTRVALKNYDADQEKDNGAEEGVSNA